MHPMLVHQNDPGIVSVVFNASFCGKTWHVIGITRRLQGGWKKKACTYSIENFQRKFGDLVLVLRYLTHLKYNKNERPKWTLPVGITEETAAQIFKFMVSAARYDHPGCSWHTWGDPRP